MKYKTYLKLRSKAPEIRRVSIFAVAVIIILCLFVVAIKTAHYNVSAAANSEEDIQEGMTVEFFKPIDCSLSEELQEYTYYVCLSCRVDFELAMAIMFTESRFDPQAVSGTGDYGLMQINEINLPELSDKLGITDITSPYQNIRSGVYLLGKLTAKYEDPAKAIMAYNIGEYGASSLWNEGIHSTSYVNTVMAKYEEYKRLCEE